MEMLEVIGTVEDSQEFFGLYYFDVYCHICDTEVYNVPICQASLCPICKSTLLPCHICIEQNFCKKGEALY